jgi:hypothetical protein
MDIYMNVCVCVCSLFNNVFSDSDYIALKEGVMSE